MKPALVELAVLQWRAEQKVDKQSPERWQSVVVHLLRRVQQPTCEVGEEWQ